MNHLHAEDENSRVKLEEWDLKQVKDLRVPKHGLMKPEARGMTHCCQADTGVDLWWTAERKQEQNQQNPQGTTLMTILDS